MSTTSTSSRTCRCRTAASSTCWPGSRCRNCPGSTTSSRDLRAIRLSAGRHPPVHREQWSDRRRQHQLRTERDQALAVEILRWQFAQIAMNHSIGCGSGYMSAIVPTGVCPAIRRAGFLAGPDRIGPDRTRPGPAGKPDRLGSGRPGRADRTGSAANPGSKFAGRCRLLQENGGPRESPCRRGLRPPTRSQARLSSPRL